MKTLEEINDNYIKDIVYFFCFEYYKSHISNDSDNSEKIFELVNQQIKKRLDSLLNDWKLEIKDLDDKSVRRENILSEILEDGGYKYKPMHFSFYYQSHKGTSIKFLEFSVNL